MNYILKSSGETRYAGSPPSSPLIERIDKVVADSESYEDGEPGPEAGTLSKLKLLIQEAEALLVPLGAPKISTYLWGDRPYLGITPANDTTDRVPRR